jgi:hypothetical protein
MSINLSGINPIPYISVDVPSDAVSVYNTLVNQLNAAVSAGGIATGPAFGDQVIGGLVAASVTAQILILVELRCIANMLDQGPGVTGDRNVMRAEELYTLISTPPTM